MSLAALRIIICPTPSHVCLTTTACLLFLCTIIVGVLCSIFFVCCFWFYWVVKHNVPRAWPRGLWWWWWRDYVLPLVFDTSSAVGQSKMPRDPKSEKEAFFVRARISLFSLFCVVLLLCIVCCVLRRSRPQSMYIFHEKAKRSRYNYCASSVTGARRGLYGGRLNSKFFVFDIYCCSFGAASMYRKATNSSSFVL